MAAVYDSLCGATLTARADDLRLAQDLVELAASIALARFRDPSLSVETKPDRSPVTAADRAVERAIRERIERARPGDAIVGEEFGVQGGGPRRWIVDPIDGTRNFTRGIPIWGTLLALEEGGRLTVAAASVPALGRRWWATAGGGAFAGERFDAGVPLHVSKIDRLGNAVVSLAQSTLRAAPAAASELAARAWHAVGLCDLWQHLLVAEGAVDVVVEHALKPWDVAAVKLIVEEAGGRLSDVNGGSGIEGGSALTTNGLLHDEVRALLERRRGD